MGNYRWGILGSGAISENFAVAIQEAGATLYGVSNRTLPRAQDFAKRFNVPNCYPTIRDMLDDANIDIVYIGATNDVHYKYLMAAIEKGKHVLCEKPFVINARQMEDVLAAAKEKNVIVQEAMTIFHMPLYKKLRELTEDGLIGKVKLVQVNFGSCKVGLSSRFFRMDAAGGALLDIGCYASSFARVFLDQIPNKFSAFVKFNPTGVDEQWVLGMENDLGQMVNMSLSMCAKQPKRGVVSGEKGYIEIDNYPRADSAKVFFVADGREETITAGKHDFALRYEVEDMEKLVAHPRETKSLELTVEIVRMLSEIRDRWGAKFPCE